METKYCRIYVDDLKIVNELSQANQISQAEVLHKKLNDTNEVKTESQKVNDDKAPPITKCIWNYYYWMAKEKDKETGQVLEWDKVDDCPILLTFPDILQLQARDRINTLMKGCVTCLVKEKALKQEQRRKERQRHHTKTSYNEFEPYRQEPSWQHTPTSGRVFDLDDKNDVVHKIARDSLK